MTDDETNTKEKNGAEDAVSSSSVALLGLFQPPASPSPPRMAMDEKKSPTPDNDEGKLQRSMSTDPMEHLDDNDDDSAAGSLSHFMSLFAPPFASVSASQQRPLLGERQSTERMSNRSAKASHQESDGMSEATPLLGSSLTTASEAGMHTPQSSMDFRDESSQKMMMMQSMLYAETPKTGSGQRCKDNNNIGSSGDSAISPNRQQLYNNSSHSRLISTSHVRTPSSAMPVISEGKPRIAANLDFPTLDHPSGSKQPDTIVNILPTPSSTKEKCWRYASHTLQALKQPSTYIGSFMYLLYHVVFCLALGSAIMRPNNPTSLLGLMTKTAALGTLAASPVYWFSLSADIPALYPTADLFLAPFLAGLAVIVDQTLAEDASVRKEENDAVFLATFGVLTAIGMSLSACLLVAASAFKLANLGSFLPFPVICGFFAAVGILTWTLAVNVDTGGKSIGAVLLGGDTDLMLYALIHHVPTLIVAGFMKYLGPKNPFFVVTVVFATIGLFYVFMFATGTSLDDMKEAGWFWSHDELIYKHSSATIGFDTWSPPAPFGVLVELHRVHWGAVKKGLSTAVALSFLYLIRCSV